MNQYIEIYNIANEGFNWFYVLFFGSVLITVTVVLSSLFNTFRLKDKVMFIGSVFLIGSVFFVYTVQSTSDYNELLQAFRQGRCVLAEGIVTGFKPIGKDGHGTESLFVANNLFEYSGHSSKAGYNKTVLDGGLIRDGIQVEIWGYNGRIAKLEILRDL